MSLQIASEFAILRPVDFKDRYRDAGKTAERDRAEKRGALVCLAGCRQGTFLLLRAVRGVRQKAKLMDEAAVNRALMRLSHEIAERNRGVENVCLVGIRRKARRLRCRLGTTLKK